VGAQYDAAQAESVALTDAVANYLQALASRSDSSGALELAQAQLNILSSRSDIVIAADLTAGGLLINAPQDEVTGVTESTGDILEASAAQAETLLAADVFVTSLVAAALQAEDVSATDFQTFTVDTAAFLVGIPITIGVGYPLVWGLVDVEQDAQWAEVIPVFSVDEIATFGGMSFGGVPYAGSFTQTWIADTERWEQINDAEDSTIWTEVVT
jgi:hypothetical protein